jgi:serine/threonine-protein kinase
MCAVKPKDLIQDRYSLEKPLGTGGMAEVWCARDERLGRQVAVKFLAPRLADDPEFLVRFFAEAQGVARISDPAVVSVLDFGQFEGRPYLVMEYLSGGPLTALLGEAILPEKAFEIAAQTARGLGAAHATGLVHRDVKPGNILLDDQGNAKVADFGIASSTSNENLTATGAAIGSPHYISPEQVAGGQATPASDVYGLGVVLYELLTGKRPFDGDNVTAIAIAHVDSDPAPPSTHQSDLGPAIDALILRCLAKDPEQRFANGYALAEALELQQPGAVLGGSGHAGAALVAATAIADPTHPAADPGFDEDDNQLFLEEAPRSRVFAGVLAAVLVLGLISAGLVMAALKEDPGPAIASEEEESPAPGPRSRKKKAKASPSPTVSLRAAAVSPSTSPSPSPSSEPKPKETKKSPKDPDPEPQPTKTAKPDPTEEPEPSPTPTAAPSSDPEPSPEPSP